MPPPSPSRCARATGSCGDRRRRPPAPPRSVYLFTPLLPATGQERAPPSRGSSPDTRYLAPGPGPGNDPCYRSPGRCVPPMRVPRLTLVSLVAVYAIMVLTTPRWYPGSSSAPSSSPWHWSGRPPLGPVAWATGCQPHLCSRWPPQGCCCSPFVLGRAGRSSTQPALHPQANPFLQDGGRARPTPSPQTARGEDRDRQLTRSSSGHGFYGANLDDYVRYVGVEERAGRRLSPGDHLHRFRRAINEERLRLYDRRQDLGFRPKPTSTRYPGSKSDPALELVIESKITPQPGLRL